MNRMKKEAGNQRFPLWLIGDSNPGQWETQLVEPLDPRHPVRHNIWTSIADVIQDELYRKARQRVDTSLLYVRNAIEGSELKPASRAVEWSSELQREVQEFGQVIASQRPMIIFSFGAFAFEFVRRSIGKNPPHHYSYWTAHRLGQEFREQLDLFNPSQVNVLPLLHRVVSGGKFIQSQEYFCDQEGANYFSVVGKAVAEKILQYQDSLQIWIE